jgi:ABC-type lipoprotein export system ATPase subunit
MRSKSFLTPIRPETGRPLIEIEAVHKTFKTPAGEFTVLKDISAGFYPGEFVSVVGKSGSGKSTLANMITGIDHPSRGSVRFGGTEIHKMSEGQMAVWRGRNIGVVFQFFQLLPMLTVRENIMLPMDFAGLVPDAEREARAMRLLALVGLDHMAGLLPNELSGGQQQAAAIARALANDPPVIVADEPTGNLDTRTAQEVFQIFTRLVDEGKTIIMVTHDNSLSHRTHRTLLLSDGELVHEQVARALHSIPHPQMLWLTRQMSARRYQPGEVIARPGSPEAGLFVITGGDASLRCQASDGGAPEGLRLGPGHFASHVDFQVLPGAAASRGAPPRLEAGPAGAEVLVMEGEALEAWLGKTQSARALLEHEAHRHATGCARPKPSHGGPA